jgi:hypothetical protein
LGFPRRGHIRTSPDFPSALHGRAGRAAQLIEGLRGGDLATAGKEFYNSLEARRWKNIRCSRCSRIFSPRPRSRGGAHVRQRLDDLRPRGEPESRRELAGKIPWEIWANLLDALVPG